MEQSVMERRTAAETAIGYLSSERRITLVYGVTRLLVWQRPVAAIKAIVRTTHCRVGEAKALVLGW